MGIIQDGTELLVGGVSSANYLEYYCSAAAAFTLSQTFTVAEAGTYSFYFYISTSNSSDNYFSSFTVTYDGTTTDKTTDITSWTGNYWYNTAGNQILPGTFDAKDKESITITLNVSLNAGAWGTIGSFGIEPYTETESSTDTSSAAS